LAGGLSFLDEEFKAQSTSRANRLATDFQLIQMGDGEHPNTFFARLDAITNELRRLSEARSPMAIYEVILKALPEKYAHVKHIWSATDHNRITDLRMAILDFYRHKTEDCFARGGAKAKEHQRGKPKKRDKRQSQGMAKKRTRADSTSW